MASEQQFKRLIQQIDPSGRVARYWQLTGGVSAQVFGLEIQRDNGTLEKLLLRIHGEVDRARNPQIAADEFRLLQALHVAGLAVPQPIFVDVAGELFDTPALIIEYVEGSSESAPTALNDFALQLAAQLAKIHNIDIAQHNLHFLPRLDITLPPRPAQLDESLCEGKIRDALASLTVAQSNKAQLLHGDYWPGNILWRDGKLAAVIDWEDAHIGDPLADVGNCRLELLWALGSEAMERFTEYYRLLSTIHFSDLPYWDLRAALRPAGKLSNWGLDPTVERTMRERHHWFVEQAIKTKLI